MDRKLICAFAAGLALAWWLHSSEAKPAPHADRPALRWIAHAAKSALWLMLVAEPAPEQHERQIVQHVVGDDGYPVLDHGRSF